MLDINDYLLIQKGEALYKFPINRFYLKYAMIGDTALLDSLEEKIEDLSVYLLNLSADMITTHENLSLSSLQLKYETKHDAELMPKIYDTMEEYQIEQAINERDLVMKDEVEDAFRDADYDKALEAFDKATTRLDESMI